jgi:hypothetical protein
MEAPIRKRKPNILAKQIKTLAYLGKAGEENAQMLIKL